MTPGEAVRPLGVSTKQHRGGGPVDASTALHAFLVGVLAVVAWREARGVPVPPDAQRAREEGRLDPDPSRWSARELRLLPGIGERRARDVVRARERHLERAASMAAIFGAAKFGAADSGAADLGVMDPGESNPGAGRRAWDPAVPPPIVPLRWEEVHGIGERTGRGAREALARWGHRSHEAWSPPGEPPVPPP